MARFPPDARNEKAPARSLSGRTSAMIEICVKGGRFVNAFFCFLAIVYARIQDELDFTTKRSHQQTTVKNGVEGMPGRTSSL